MPEGSLNTVGTGMISAKSSSSKERKKRPTALLPHHQEDYTDRRRTGERKFLQDARETIFVSEWRTPPLSGQGSAERNGDRRRMSASERAVGSSSKSWRRYQ